MAGTTTLLRIHAICFRDEKVLEEEAATTCWLDYTGDSFIGVSEEKSQQFGNISEVLAVEMEYVAIACRSCSWASFMVIRYE